MWITSDVSASNQAFMMDKPFSASDVRVLLPTVESSLQKLSYTGGRKSVFDTAVNARWHAISSRKKSRRVISPASTVKGKEALSAVV